MEGECDIRIFRFYTSNITQKIQILATCLDLQYSIY